ncbi:MAG: site-specific integrase [Bacteroidota bacterium]
MPYKREGSPYYQIRKRSLPGYGDTGVLSSRCTDKKLARDMERCLEGIAQKAMPDPSWYALLDAVCRDKSVSLPELLRAQSTGALQALKQGLSDPLLTSAVESFRELASPERSVGIGLDMLVRYAPPGAKLGELTAQNITRLCIEAEKDGRKRNSVRRTMLRAVSMLLRFHIGNAERNRIFADVQFPAEDDTREVHLSAEEIVRLLGACRELGYTELATLIRVALQTSADRGVLLPGKNMGKKLRGLLVKDVTLTEDTGRYSGEIFLYDTKATRRSRSVPLTDSLCQELALLCSGKGPDDNVFSIRYHQLDFMWKRTRKMVGLMHVRFKDLRAQTAIYAEEAGIPQTVVQRTLGHSSEAMTRRYQQRKAALSVAQAEAIEKRMLSAKNAKTQSKS